MNTSILSTSANINPAIQMAARMDQTNISIIKEMMVLAEIEKRKGREVISLGVGIPHYRMPKYIRDSITETLQTKPDIDKYTYFAGLPKLRQLIASQAQAELSIPTTEDNILITPGSMAGLLYTMTALLNPGDEVIIPSPYFPSYKQQIHLAGATVVESALKVIDGKYELDLEDIKAKITQKTKAIIINSPNNPSGAVYGREAIEKIAEIAIENNLYVITDEVYDYLIFDNYTQFKIASIEKLWPKLIRCCSFSKKYGMTGWRAGYVQADVAIINSLLKIHDNTIVCTPHVSQEAVYTAISVESEENTINRDSLATNRDLICARLDKLPDLFLYVKPLGTYYIFPEFKLDMDSVEFSKLVLAEAGVVVIPGIGFGDTGERHVRMSFGATAEEINKAFDKIEAWWSAKKFTK
jgi:aspartate/methionine/tyrosine aminotransferase